MRNWPLAVKIWGVFASITLSIFVLLAILLPWTLKDFFTEQIYDILLDSQKSVQFETKVADELQRMMVPAAPGGMEQRMMIIPKAQAGTPAEEYEKPGGISVAIPFQPPEGPVVQHMLLWGTGSGEESGYRQDAFLPQSYVKAMEDDAQKQQAPVQKYARDIENKTIFYVIRKDQLVGKPSYMVSYSWGNYRNDLVFTMFGRLMLLMVALILCSWLPCLALAKYLTRPLVQMEQHVGRMAERDWHEPLRTNRKDEIGRLARAIETMRQRLVRQDKAQQFFLQNISHELKTPVMVIRSYAQSIMDGLFPKGTLQNSVEVIMKESDRLEKRVRDLLYLNKLNYFSSREKQFQMFDLNAVVEDVAERLRCRRTDVSWTIEANGAEICGDREQWSVALENLLDNQLRYAKGHITVEAIPPVEAGGQPASGAVTPTLRIWNDGPPLDEESDAGLFEPFSTGTDGQFGLGLAIVRQIAAYHGMTVRAVNEDGGVAFYVEPQRKKESNLWMFNN
jgi:two-component system sensor histidine kinase CssS